MKILTVWKLHRNNIDYEICTEGKNMNVKIEFNNEISELWLSQIGHIDKDGFWYSFMDKYSGLIRDYLLNQKW